MHRRTLVTSCSKRWLFGAGKIIMKGFTRQQLRENLPGLSVATLDRAAGELVEKYLVKQWRKGRETFYAPRRPSMNRPERQLEVQRQNPDTILLANRRGLETVLKTRLPGSLLRVSLLQSALREQTRLRLMDMVQNTRELFVVYIGRGKPDTIIVTHWKKLPYLFKDTWTQVKLTAM